MKTIAYEKDSMVITESFHNESRIDPSLEFIEIKQADIPSHGRDRWYIDFENKKILVAEPTDTELAQIAQSEMITELNWCDLQIKLHTSSDKRAVSTLDDIYAYARACRDYVQNVDGELTIMTDKPVRPS